MLTLAILNKHTAKSVSGKMVAKNRQPKKLYIDVCTLCRPFDDQNVMKIRIETDA